MDAPAMLQRKHVPEDVGQVEGEGAGGQAQLHRDEKQHKPVLKKVKDKVKKIKNTLAGNSRGGHDGEHGGGGDDERMGDADAANSNSSEEAEEDAAERDAAVEKGGYMEDVEDKPVVTEPEPEPEPDPEVHGAPMYESERAPPVQELVAKYDQPARTPAMHDAKGDGAAPRTAAVQEAEGEPQVRLGDIGGPAVEDPAAPRSTTPAAREGEDIGTTPVVQQFENMNLSDDPAHVGAGRKDEAADTVGGGAGGASYTDRLRNAAAVPTEYGKKLASTVYEKVAGAGTGTAVGGAGKRDDERTEEVPAPTTGAAEWKDAPEADTDATKSAGYTDKVRSAAAGTTGYGKQLASTVYDKVAGVGTAVAPNLRPQEGAAKTEDAHSEAMPVSDTGAEEWKDAPDAAATDASAANGATGPGYTDKIKSAAAGTTEYGKQLASTVYEKVAGAGSAVAGKVQQVTPGAGSQQDATATPGAGGQDKGAGITGYIAEKLRPGDDERALSETISGAVQQRKDAVGGTVTQRVPAPGQVMNKAREAVSSLTGGNRVSETVQPTTATGEDVKEGYAAEAPVIRGEEVGDAKLNTNTV